MTSARIIVGTDLQDDVLVHDMLYGPPTVQTRYAPGMPGVSLQNIGGGEYLNPITGEIYNFQSGFKTMGRTYPGGSVNEQTNADAETLVMCPREPIVLKTVR